MDSRYGWRSWRNEEFQEEDVWAVMRESFTTSKAESSTIISPRRLPSAAKMIPRANKNTTQQEPKMIQQSAPVNIPDWSKIYGNSSKKASNGNWDSDDDEDEDEDDGDGDGDGKMMPPHEWIARKHARSEVYSSSVCEGAGRTLKGRDLSRVRHAVLTSTGFIG